MEFFGKHPKILIVNVVAISLFILISYFPTTLQFYDIKDFLGMHIMLEMMSIIISFSIFIFGWKLTKFNRSSSLLLFSLTFLVVGTIDFFHTLSYYGMPHFITDSSVSKATWLWIIARTFMAFSTLVIFSIPERSINKSTANRLLTGSFLITVIAIFSVYRYEKTLPLLVIESVGTSPLKNGFEYMISMLYLILIFISYHHNKRSPNIFFVNVLLGSSMMLLSELNFTLYASVYDINNLYGHILKAVAYYFILQAFYYTTIEHEKENEQKVNETKEELSSLLMMQDGVIFKYQKKDKRFIHTLCEGELLDKINFKREWIIGKSIDDLSISKTTEIVKHYQIAWEEKRKVNCEIMIENRHLYVSLKPITHNGEVIEVLGTLADITELKEMEIAVMNSEKLGVVGELAAGVAHELRNPLTTLKGFLQLMRPDLTDSQKFFIDLMLSETERLESITHEFMTVARPHAIVFKPASVTVIAKDVIRLLHPQAALNGVEIKLEINAENTFIHCDANQIKQVWINIIKNSLEAMPLGGNIYVRIDSLNDNFLSISIKDEGIGMSAKILAKLGQPFFTSKEGGHGLGMMMTKKVIDAHQGRMSATSESGKGTKITIELPYIKADQKTAS